MFLCLHETGQKRAIDRDATSARHPPTLPSFYDRSYGTGEVRVCGEFNDYIIGKKTAMAAVQEGPRLSGFAPNNSGNLRRSMIKSFPWIRYIGRYCTEKAERIAMDSTQFDPVHQGNFCNSETREPVPTTKTTHARLLSLCYNHAGARHTCHFRQLAAWVHVDVEISREGDALILRPMPARETYDRNCMAARL